MVLYLPVEELADKENGKGCSNPPALLASNLFDTIDPYGILCLVLHEISLSSMINAIS